MKKEVVLITGNELRHQFFRKYLALDDGIDVLSTYCESEKGNLKEVVAKQDNNNLRKNHLAARESTEIDFFGLYCGSVPDKSNPVYIEKGRINDNDIVETIKELDPDLLVAYGCSIIKSELLSLFEGRFINIHLGLSPYYRGSGTNFWPFVNKELQFVGTTFMYIDSGIDTGEIIHQIRADIVFDDNIHQVGNRLIRDSVIECTRLIRNFDKLERMRPIAFDKKLERYYKKKDFTEDALAQAYRNLEQGLIEDYLLKEEFLVEEYPIITNSLFTKE